MTKKIGRGRVRILALLMACLLLGGCAAQAEPEPPTRLEAAVREDSSVLLTWEPSPGGTAYRVYRRAGTETDFKFQNDVTDCRYADPFAQPGQTYLYKVSVLSVPRDTLVNVSRNTKKINAAYGVGGVEQLMDEVTGLIGFRPDHYLKVDIRGFKAIVNQLGGVSFYVPEDMYHEDGAGFTIDLKEGSQWLDGDQALQLVRYRLRPERRV